MMRLQRIMRLKNPARAPGVAPIVPRMPDFDWERPLKDLHELAELTGGPDGARRLAWSEDWRTAREWLLGKLAETDATVERDVAGNLWATIPGSSDKIVVVGSHIDAVPHGGWLDGCLGLLRGGRGAARAQGRDARGHAEADRLGRRGGRALRAQPARLVRRRRHARARRGAAPQGRPGHRAPGRADGERRRPRHDGRGRAARHRRLSRAAHRAGTAAGGGGQARRGGDRLLRRRAPRDHVHRQGQPRRLARR